LKDEKLGKNWGNSTYLPVFSDKKIEEILSYFSVNYQSMEPNLKLNMIPILLIFFLAW